MYERVGGDAFIIALVERFYASVSNDPILREMYPPDLEPPKAHLTAFLIQISGGPARYSAERGHPRLRMRHQTFRIGQQERDSWVRHMTAAVHSSPVSPSDAAELIGYFERTATFLMNKS